MDDLDGQLLDHEEMNDMFSRPIGQNTYMTDADLENGSFTKTYFFIYKILIPLKS